MTTLTLAPVTLCCVDCTPRLPWALKALQRCLANVAFGDAIVCSDRGSMAGHALPDGVRWVEIPPLTSIAAYSDFMLKGLAPHVRTSHVLIVQWDGFVLNPSAWKDEFLAFDYIGAPWNHIAPQFAVGNGGFSLRSSRLLQALLSPAIVPEHPEDICICVTHRGTLEAQGMAFAPRHLAEAFAVEEGELSADVFGFHGPYHLPDIFGPAETVAFIESLSPSQTVAGHYFGIFLRNVTRAAKRDAQMLPALRAFERLVQVGVDELQGTSSLTPQALGLCKALVRYGQFPAGRRLLRNRRAAGGGSWGDAKLSFRLNLNSLLAHVGLR